MGGIRIMKTTSTSVTLGKVANEVSARGRVSDQELEKILREHGVDQLRHSYKDKLVRYSYLIYNSVEHYYRATPEAQATGRIRITVRPYLNAEEVRRHLVGMLAGYHGLIEVSEVDL